MEPGSKLITTLYQCSRVIEDRELSPSATILDSQSVKTATPSSVEVGDDAAKRLKGRKRHLLVDISGLVLMVVVTAASIPERAGVQLVFARLERVRHWVNRLLLVWVDGGYQGEGFMRWVMDTHGWIVEVVMRAGARKGFVPLPRRWVVERYARLV